MEQEVAPAHHHHHHHHISPLSAPQAAATQAAIPHINPSLLSQRTQSTLAPPTPPPNPPPRSPTIHAAPIYQLYPPHAFTPPALSVGTRRIAQLRTYLDPRHRDYQHERQHVNILVAIWMYETWVLDGRTQVVIMGGRVVTEWEARRWGDRRWCWVESGLIV